MAAAAAPLLLLLIGSCICMVISSHVQKCPMHLCDTKAGQMLIDFPFSLTQEPSSDNPECTMYPGMYLTCVNGTSLLLNLPYASGHFMVNYINYSSQYMYVSALGDCLAAQFLNFSLEGTSFIAPASWEYAFFNCSPPLHVSSFPIEPTAPTGQTVDCMSGSNFSVVVKEVTTENYTHAHCTKISDHSLPYWLDMLFSKRTRNLFRLSWQTNRSKICRLKNSYSSDVQCSATHGHSHFSAKYGLLTSGFVQAVFYLWS